jgi:hypothetical protein
MLPADPRRFGPRITVESFCSELHGDSLRHALVVDMSEEGVRLERPIGGPRSRSLQLELEVPGMDEIVWARGEVCFDEVRRGPGGGILRTSGVRLVSTAARHRRILREYVNDTWRQQQPDVSDCLLDAACYLRG